MPKIGRALKSVEIRTITKEGECALNIRLEIVLSGDGLRAGVNEDASDMDKPLWPMEEFGDIPKVQFGKKV